MPSFEQLKAYLQNPDVALDEAKHRWQNAQKDVLSQGGEQQAESLNSLVPGMTSPEQESDKLASMEGLSNIAGMAKVKDAGSLAQRMAAQVAEKSAPYGQVFQAEAPVAKTFGKVNVVDNAPKGFGKVTTPDMVEKVAPRRTDELAEYLKKFKNYIE